MQWVDPKPEEFRDWVAQIGTKHAEMREIYWRPDLDATVEFGKKEKRLVVLLVGNKEEKTTQSLKEAASIYPIVKLEFPKNGGVLFVNVHVEGKIPDEGFLSTLKIRELPVVILYDPVAEEVLKRVTDPGNLEAAIKTTASQISEKNKE